MRKSENKPLSFSTTMRNPNRISKFLECILDFENEDLNSSLINKIVRKVIKNKLYKPTIIDKNQELKKIYIDENKTFNKIQLDYIINNSIQKHKEAGFDIGWESRFDTWFKIIKEFGFIYYKKGEKLEISETGKILSNLYKKTTSIETSRKIFLNALMKYHTNNPFRKNSNENVPIPLILNLLKLLKENGYENGIYKKELPFITCWYNNNHYELYNFIINFRKKYGFNFSDEFVYEECLKLLKSSNTKRFKFVQIIREGIDDLIRKLRITDIFSIRGMGRFIDINTFEQKNINYIIKKYSKIRKFDNEYEYFKYVGTLDHNIIEEEKVNIENFDDVKFNALKRIAQKYTKEAINEQISIIQKNRASDDTYLKLIDAPTRLEFLMSLYLVKNFPNLLIKPNYNIDDEGNPTFTAKGGVADIEIIDIYNNVHTLVEVTLISNRQQSIIEIPAVTRHLKEKRIEKSNNNVFSIFLAPYIHEDTKFMCDFAKYREDLVIKPYSIFDF